MSTAKVCLQCGTQFDGETRFCPHDGSALKLVDPGSALIGQVVADRYLVHRKLGAGGMGEVYLAEQVRIGRKCALKVIRPALVQDADSVLRFNREASNAARISHPNVVQVYDFGEAKDGTIFLAMEFIEGESLASLLERERKVAPRRAVAITAQVASALTAAHELKIVHRDLKPDNIMLARNRDGSDQVKVVDFGVSRIMDSAEQKVTGTGLVIGTPEYMSPEQFTGVGIDERSDVYSLALIVFRMLAGAAPFEASSVQQALEARFNTQPKRLAEANPRIQWPPGLQEVLDRGMALRVDDRYQSVEAFATAVAAITTYWDPEEGRIPTEVNVAAAPPAPLTPRPSSRAPQGTNAAFANGVEGSESPPAVVTAPTPLAGTLAGAARQSAAVVPPEPKRAGMLWVAALLVVVVGGAIAIKGALGGGGASSGAEPSPSITASPDSAVVVTSPGGGASPRNAVADTTLPERPTPSPEVPPSAQPKGAGGTSDAVESATVMQTLERLRALTDSSATPTQAREAIALARTIAPTTKAGRVEMKYRVLEANILLNRTRETCTLLAQLQEEAPGTRFEAAVLAYAPIAQASCR